MQRHEIVDKAIRTGTPVNVTAGEIVKYWTIKDQEHAVAKTEMQIGLIESDNSDVDVRIETPKKYQMGITVKLSSKIIIMIDNFWGQRYCLTPKEEVISYLHGVISVLKIKLSAEQKHLAFLNEEV